MSMVFVVLAVSSTCLREDHPGLPDARGGREQERARASGIDEKRVKVVAFLSSGAPAIAGLLNISFLGNVQGTTGQGMELNSIAAVIIGGTSLAGGEGTVIGTSSAFSSWGC